MSVRNLARPFLHWQAPRQRTAAAIAAAALSTSLLAAPAAQAAPASRPAADAPVPVLHWRPCDGGFQCATARVPLDYRQPRGATIRLAVVRHLATDPAHRIGSLFVNGGGPNEQIVSFLGALHNFPAALRARFDIITFDPRGFGYSTAIRCFPSEAAEAKLLSGLPRSRSGGSRTRRTSGPLPGSTGSARSATARCWTTTAPRTWPGTWTCSARRCTTRC